jgi:multidrug transporter EmrE-like cation transporter
MGYLFVALMIVLTLYGQFALKWEVSAAGPLPADPSGQFHYVLGLLLSPWVISGLAAAFLASVCWMLALTKLELSRAYPFTALSLVMVIFASALLFGEALSVGKLMGTALIVAGVFVVAFYS